MPLPHAYRRLAQEHPDVIKAYESLADGVRAAGPLDAKSVALVKLALALGLVSDHLASGRRALHGLAKESEVKLADAGALPASVWMNVNTPAEWERFVRSIPGDAPRG